MPPINAATLVPTANSPPGQDLTRPTHSMPLTSAASAYSPLRMCISAWFIPNALTSMTTWPGFGAGSGSSLITKFSGPPNFCMTIARMTNLRIEFVTTEHRLKVLSALRVAGCQTEHPVEEVANGCRNLRAVRLQREVAGVEEADISLRDVALERFGSCGHEERVVPPPHR